MPSNLSIAALGKVATVKTVPADNVLTIAMGPAKLVEERSAPFVSGFVQYGIMGVVAVGIWKVIKIIRKKFK